MGHRMERVCYRGKHPYYTADHVDADRRRVDLGGATWTYCPKSIERREFLKDSDVRLRGLWVSLT